MSDYISEVRGLLQHLAEEPAERIKQLMQARSRLQDEIRRVTEQAPMILINRRGQIVACDFAKPESARQDTTLAGDATRYLDSRYPSTRTPGCDEEGADERYREMERWSIVAGAEYYEVKEIEPPPRYEAREEGEGSGVWGVWDTTEDDWLDLEDMAAIRTQEEAQRKADNLNFEEDPPDSAFRVWDTEEDKDATEDIEHDYDITYDDQDESDAEEAAERANRERYRENALAWPWAWNTCWDASDDARWEEGLADWPAAGFVLAEYEPSGILYAGVDGCGYSFSDAHIVPLYLLRAARGHWTVETNAGPRRVRFATDEELEAIHTAWEAERKAQDAAWEAQRQREAIERGEGLETP